MEARILREYFEEKNDSSAALLFLGTQARSRLMKLYVMACHEGYDCNWIESPRSPEDFWYSFIGGTKAVKDFSDSLCETLDDNGPCLSQMLLKNIQHRHHLFIPDIDILFYEFDVLHAEKRAFNNGLRSVWQTASNLNIYASAKAADSESFTRTLGNYDFMFYIGNFRTITS